MEKRISCRAIIFKDDNVVTMRRIKEDDEYYTYPGGGLEEGETLEECVVREVKEEFGINIKVIKLVYEYNNNNSNQYFYLCEWTDGEIGTGNGPEMVRSSSGKYIPTMIKINEMMNVKFQPLIITRQLLNDLNEYGKGLDSEAKIINDNN